MNTGIRILAALAALGLACSSHSSGGDATDAAEAGDAADGLVDSADAPDVHADGETGDAGVDGADGSVTDGSADAAGDAELDDGSTAAPCPAGAAGLACLFAQYDALRAGCDEALAAAFGASLAARHGDLPAWRDGRALFAERSSAHVAGDWNGWSTTDLELSPLCSTSWFVADAVVPSGRHEFKLVDAAGTWSLDPEDWAFAYDDFAGNPDHRNSVLDTYDSGLGELVEPDIDMCPPAPLSGCRRYVTYLPAGYGDPAQAERTYPVLFMHDGQNVFDDTTCCFGNGGWEINVALDAALAAGAVVPVVVVGFPNGGAERENEYSTSVANGGHRELFMDWQVGTLQPTAATLWRIDLDQAFVAGSSLGGLLSFHLMLAHPELYAGAASLSGAFWPDDWLIETTVPATGHVPVALYQDWGGGPDPDADGYADNVAVRDLLDAAGWTPQAAPDCTLAPDALCWFWDAGAAHNELAWRARAPLFLRHFFAP